MITKVIFLCVALYAQSEVIIAFSIPFTHHSTATHHYNEGGNHANHGGHHEDLRYHGPTAVPHVLHDGHIADTHEVAAAKAEHLAAVSKAQSHKGYHGGVNDGFSGAQQQHAHPASYHGPTAVPHVLHDGHIADTHEVAAAKAEHLAAVSKAQSHKGYHGGVNDGFSGAQQQHAHPASYHGPTAVPHVLHDGHIADTHEVAAAKAEHFAAVSKAQFHNGYHGGVQSGYSGTHQGYAHHASYHGPTARPQVLHSGYLADTHEVTVAKQHHHHALSVANLHSHPNYHH